MLYYIILTYIKLCYVILYYIMLYYMILYYNILYYIILCFIILYYIMFYYIILYYIILYYIIFYYNIYIYPFHGNTLKYEYLVHPRLTNIDHRSTTHRLVFLSSPRRYRGYASCYACWYQHAPGRIDVDNWWCPLMMSIPSLATSWLSR